MEIGYYISINHRLGRQKASKLGSTRPGNSKAMVSLVFLVSHIYQRRYGKAGNP